MFMDNFYKSSCFFARNKHSNKTSPRFQTEWCSHLGIFPGTDAKVDIASLDDFEPDIAHDLQCPEVDIVQYIARCDQFSSWLRSPTHTVHHPIDPSCWGNT